MHGQRASNSVSQQEPCGMKTEPESLSHALMGMRVCLDTMIKW